MRKIDKSHSAASVILVGLDPTAVGMVRETLAAEAVLPAASVSFGDAIPVVKRMRPDVVVVGFQESQEAALAIGQALTREEPSVTLVALSDGSDAETILAAMRVGYKEFVVLPGDSSQLSEVVHGAAYSASEEINGQVVAIIGAKGGVGTTLLATHLGAEFAAIHRVLLVDLDLSAGDVATMLDLNPRDSIMDLLPRADRIDERMLTGAAVVHRSKVHVLGHTNDSVIGTEVSGDDIYSVLLAAADAYQFVIIDCGVYLDEAVVTSLQVADIIMLVTTPDILSVRDAHKKMAALQVHDIEPERIKIVVNRLHRNSYVLEEDIEKNLGVAPSGVVADDPKLVNQAINEGKLIRELNRRSECARDISKLVGLLTDDEDDLFDDEFEDQNSGFISRIFGRG